MIDPDHRRSQINLVLYSIVFQRELDEAAADGLADDLLRSRSARGPGYLLQVIREAIEHGDPFHGPGRIGDLLKVPRSDDELRAFLTLLADRLEARLAQQSGGLGGHC